MFERIAPEQHDTLDGIPEPSENRRLAGHANVSGLLASAYAAGKLPHALILAGPVGIGKATLAFHLAHHLLKYPQADMAPARFVPPEPLSPLFRQIAMAAHPSILHLTRPFDDKNKRFKTVVSVDEIRKVGQFLSMTSHDGGYRIVIVDPADDMNTNAANALLKNLEEPPPRSLFILIVHAPGRLLPTIRSRCQIVRMDGLSDDALLAALEGITPLPGDPDSCSVLLKRAGGSARTAILLTQYGGLEIAGALDALVYRAKTGDVAAAHRLADAVAGRGQAIAFDIFNRRALDLLSDGARAAALAGDLVRANRLARTWQDARNAVSETEIYNLDKKQHALTMIDRLDSALRM